MPWYSPAGDTSGTEMRPPWLALLAPLPGDCIADTKPVASAEQVAAGTAGPITDWQNVSVHLSEPRHGLRHVLVTLDGAGTLLAASDHVMFVRKTTPDGDVATLTDHESVGGRFESDGSFLGTRASMTLETDPETDASLPTRTDQRSPTEGEVAALRRIVDAVVSRSRGNGV